MRHLCKIRGILNNENRSGVSLLSVDLRSSACELLKDSLVLEPGADIRPVIDTESVKLLLERLYGISVLELTELNGYDDRNYKVVEDPNVKNPLITNHQPYGYVLKIMNSMDSQNANL
ncbi:unnamed protein product [Leptidea sinapis]|uniref:Uncharacterized protein n=1 Tax=Leptidea sinapis TaxID=189913 RepID=A0A5E4Q389_9NEOP|nr:unnamed protein product [Leptidea sinapis]